MDIRYFAPRPLKPKNPIVDLSTRDLRIRMERDRRELDKRLQACAVGAIAAGVVVETPLFTLCELPENGEIIDSISELAITLDWVRFTLYGGEHVGVLKRQYHDDGYLWENPDECDVLTLKTWMTHHRAERALHQYRHHKKGYLCVPDARIVVVLYGKITPDSPINPLEKYEVMASGKRLPGSPRR